MKRRSFLIAGLTLPLAPTFARALGEEIVTCRIHPAIGIARIGTSGTKHFLGPEVPFAVPSPEGGFRDSEGRLARQAVRFRVYGYDAAGRVVRELTADDAEIRWRVDVANTKAAWYDFHLPLDLPEARRTGKPISRRNPELVGEARASLAIRPGAKEIRGASQRTPLDGGRFADRDVSLGELRTDDRGRLIVLGGLGASHPIGAARPLRDGINNDGWHDDTSDGSVDATVRLGGRAIPVIGAWVVVGPPAFAPGIGAAVTLYDRLRETFGGALASRPSFARDVHPIVARLARHPWVNAGFEQQFGVTGAIPLGDPAFVASLSDASPAARATRRRLFTTFRNPSSRVRAPFAVPSYYGDHDVGAHEHMSLLPHQYRALSRWAEGRFVADHDADGPSLPSELDALPLAERPLALDRAQLDAASGGPFHPGIETGFAIRVRALYDEPFRLRRRALAEVDHGAFLATRGLSAPGGVFDGVAPGDLTRWLGVPWQMDTYDCRFGYDPVESSYLPSFWPAFVPNQVVSPATYAALQTTTTRAEALALLEHRHRVRWLRGFEAYDDEERLRFVEQWSGLGLVLRAPGPASLGQDVFVETSRTLPEPAR